MPASRAAPPAIHERTMRAGMAALIAVGALAACTTPVQVPAPVPAPAPPPAVAVAPVTATRGEFTIVANKLDTWNAVGQVLVNTDGVEYEGRAQMLDLYTVRYHDQPLLLITRAMLLSDTVRDSTTLVTARTLDGKPIDSDAAADLLAVLQRALPAQIEQDRAKQATDAAAQAASRKSRARTPKTRVHGKP